MSRLRPVALGLLAAACALCGPLLAPPDAAATTPPVADCNANSRLTHQYTVTQLRTALSTMPADVKEYTDCNDVIQRALTAQISGAHLNGGSSGGSSGGSFLPVPVLIVLGVLLLTAAGYALAAARRRGSRQGERPEGPPARGPSGPAT